MSLNNVQNNGVTVPGTPDTLNFPGGFSISGTVATWNGSAPCFGNERDITIKQFGGIPAITSNTPVPQATVATDGTTAALTVSKINAMLAVANGTQAALQLPRTTYIAGAIDLGTDFALIGSYGQAFGGSTLFPVPNGATPPTSALRVDGNNQIRGVLKNFSIDARLLGGTSTWAVDLRTFGQYLVDDINISCSQYGTSTRDYRGFRLNRADGSHFGHLVTMEHAGGYGMFVGSQTRGCLFDWLDVESNQSAYMVGSYITNYLSDVGVDVTAAASGSGSVIFRGNLFSAIKNERSGTWYLDSKAETYTSFGLSQTTAQLTRRSSHNHIYPWAADGTQQSVLLNVGWANRVRATNLTNWITRTDTVLGVDGCFSALPTYPGDALGDWHLPSLPRSGGLQQGYVVWARTAANAIAVETTKKAVAAIDYIDASSGSEVATRLSQSCPTDLLLHHALNEFTASGQDDFTFVSAVPAPAQGRVRFRSKINTGGQGAALGQVSASVNLIRNGTFGWGGVETRSPSGIAYAAGCTATVVADGTAGWFGAGGDPDDVVRGGLRLVGGTAANQQVQWAPTIRAGRKYLAMMSVKINDADPANTNGNTTSGLRMVASGNAAHGTHGVQWASCDFAYGVDGGRGDSSRILQCVWEVPVNWYTAPTTISLGTIGKMGCVYVEWVALVDLEAPTLPVTRGRPSVGNWLIGERARDLDPLASGYAEWQCADGGTPGTWTGLGSLWEQRLPYAASLTVDVTQGSQILVGTLTGNLTVAATPGTAGTKLLFAFTQDATGGRSIAWASGTNGFSGATLTTGGTAKQRGFVEFTHNGTSWVQSFIRTWES